MALKVCFALGRGPGCCWLGGEVGFADGGEDVGEGLGIGGEVEDRVGSVDTHLTHALTACAVTYSGWAHMMKRDYETGLQELSRATELAPDSTMFLAQLGEGFALAGRTKEARRILRGLAGMARERYVPPYHLAYVCTGLSDQRSWKRSGDERPEVCVP